MNFSFIFNHPWWFLLLCIIAGLAVSAGLYYKNNDTDISLRLKQLLAAFRFLVITILCFLFLSPLIQMQVTSKQQPVILIFHDNSQSITSGSEAESIASNYPAQLQQFAGDLSTNFQVATYQFGQSVRPLDTLDFQDPITDISEIFNTLDALYTNRNVGAVVIASDGLFNRGQNPLFLTSGLLFPVYTIAMGDTIPRRDLIISRLQHNRITYLNNIFPVEITIEARQAANQRSRVRVIHQNQTVFEQAVTFSSNSEFQTLVAELEANETGIKRYRVEIEPIANEISLDNNVREFFIDVIDARQKVLILAANPHPDVGALKQALDQNENYETEVALARDFNKNIRDYDIIIWHQLPAQSNAAVNLLTQASQANMPQLFIFGSQSGFNTFNRLQTGIQVNLRTAGTNDSRAEVNSQFALFQLSEETLGFLAQFPPLQTPFAVFNLAPGAQVLARQRIGNVITEYPLIAFSQTTEKKTGIIAGEGIWRWRLNNFLRNNNHDAFNELISRTIQFLSVVEDKSFFRVTTNNFLMENEPAIFDAELYNPSYELVNTPDVFLTITNEQGENFEYTFNRTGNAYRLNAGIFPVGEYRYTARTRLGNEDFTANGIFTVSPLNMEGLNTVANHQLLFQLSENTGGTMFYPGQWEELAQAIQNRNDILPVLYTQYQYEEIINLRWIFFVLLIFLAVEWFIRKYAGGY